MILCSLFVGSFLMHSSSGEGAKQPFRQESFTERWGLQSQKGIMNRFPKKLALSPTLGFRKLPRGLLLGSTLWEREAQRVGQRAKPSSVAATARPLPSRLGAALGGPSKLSQEAQGSRPPDLHSHPLGRGGDFAQGGCPLWRVTM